MVIVSNAMFLKPVEKASVSKGKVLNFIMKQLHHLKSRHFCWVSNGKILFDSWVVGGSQDY
jgi:hypothetical protein